MRYFYFYNVFRYYGKNALRRKPIRILNRPEESSSLVSTDNDKIPKTKTSLTSSQEAKPASLNKYEANQQIVCEYEKLQKHDERFTKLLTSLKSRKHRERTGKILLEGKRLINDAIEAGLELKTIYFSKPEILSQIKLKDPKKIELCKVFYKTLQLWSDLKTCPGIMGIFKKPNQDDLILLSDPIIPVTIICDNIRDPGNLGSIIRNAAAAGCQNILLLKGCTDPWELKVLRAGCGGHFRLPIINNIEWPHIMNYISKNSTIYVADNDADIEKISLYDIEKSPIMDNCINYDKIDEKQTDNNMDMRYVTQDENNPPILIDESFESLSELQNYEDMTLPCYLYSDIKFPKKDIVLYVGGETYGVNPRILKLACEYGGKKISIPLENNMESLNSSFAVTIILYEIKRQHVEYYVTK